MKHLKQWIRVSALALLFSVSAIQPVQASVNDPEVRPPVFSQDPIVLPSAQAQMAYTASIAAFAIDPQGSPMTFSKVDGPSWLVMSADGEIFGTPALSDIGQSKFVVQVTNAENLSAQATVMLTVIK